MFCFSPCESGPLSGSRARLKSSSLFMGVLAIVLACAALSVNADLSVRDGKLYEQNGNELIIRGANFPELWFAQNSDRALRQMAEKGANAVRVVIGNGAYGGRIATVSSLQNTIAQAKSQGLITVVSLYDTTGFGDNGEAVNLESAVDTWIQLKDALIGQEDYVILNYSNEPFGNGALENEFLDANLSAVPRLRAAGIENVLIMSASQWGQDWRGDMRFNLDELYASDPSGNLMFGVAMYEQYPSYYVMQKYIADFYDQGYGLVVLEFGPTHLGSDVDEDSIMELADAYGIGTFGWSWSLNDEDRSPLDLVTDMLSGNLTEWGERLFTGPNGIADSAQQAVVFSERAVANPFEPKPRDIPTIDAIDLPVSSVEAVMNLPQGFEDSTPVLQGQDVGLVGFTGGSEFESEKDRYLLKASGADIWLEEDGFHYAHANVTGDFIAVVQLRYLAYSHEWAKAGIMARADLDADAINTFAVLTPASRSSQQFRMAKGKASEGEDPIEPFAAGSWLMLERAGNVFSASVSSDGESWIQLDEQSVDLADTIYLGLALTSHNNAFETEAVFDKFAVFQKADVSVPTPSPTLAPTLTPTLTPSATPEPSPTLQPSPTPTVQPSAEPSIEPTSAPTSSPTVEPTVQPTLTPQLEFLFTSSQDIGAPAIEGSSRFDEDSDELTVSASGADIWEYVDQFHFVSQSLQDLPSGDFDVRARVASLSGTDPWEKVGIMLRQGSTGNAAHTTLFISYDNGAAFQYRASEGLDSNSTELADFLAGDYLRLTRIGDVVQGYVSKDGTSWTLVDEREMPATAADQIGFAYTSHNNAALGAAVLGSIDARFEYLESNPTPSVSPTQAPTVLPSAEPSPSPVPTQQPSPVPTIVPSVQPTTTPTTTPTLAPTAVPSPTPTPVATLPPSPEPTPTPQCDSVAITEGAIIRLRDNWQNRYLHVGTDKAGTPVYSYERNESWWSQQWKVQRVNARFVRLINRWSGHALHSRDGGEWQGVYVSKETETSVNWQTTHFELELHDCNTYNIRGRKSGYYLSSQEQQSASVKAAALRSDWSSQRWTIESVD